MIKNNNGNYGICYFFAFQRQQKKNQLYVTATSSTSKFNVESAGIGPIRRFPYPIFDGIIIERFPPTFIPSTPISKPLTTSP